MTRSSAPTTAESVFLILMMAVNVSTGILSSFSLTWPVSAIHWSWTILGAVTLCHVYGYPIESGKLTTRTYWYMAFAAQIMILEMISLFSFFQTLSTLCPLDADVSGGAESITQECIWAGVYQFHGVYLSFVHIMFFVLLNCCIQDSMKERKEGGDIPLYLNWHNFTALSFPALFLNMVSIVLMQKYIALFENVDEWDGYVAHAFWLVLKGLAAGNIVFNVVIFWWFLQSHREVARLETVLKFIPFLNEYASVDRRVIDVEKAVEIA